MLVIESTLIQQNICVHAARPAIASKLTKTVRHEVQILLYLPPFFGFPDILNLVLCPAGPSQSAAQQARADAGAAMQGPQDSLQGAQEAAPKGTSGPRARFAEEASRDTAAAEVRIPPGTAHNMPHVQWSTSKDRLILASHLQPARLHKCVKEQILIRCRKLLNIALHTHLKNSQTYTTCKPSMLGLTCPVVLSSEGVADECCRHSRSKAIVRWTSLSPSGWQRSDSCAAPASLVCGGVTCHK